jgi:hypothetical protein
MLFMKRERDHLKAFTLVRGKNGEVLRSLPFTCCFSFPEGKLQKLFNQIT